MPPKFKALTCPFCGSPVTVTPYTNGMGASVECSSDECVTWGSKFDLDEWNAQRVISKRSLYKYVFDVVPIYKGMNFHKTQEFTCRCCGRSAEQPIHIKHKKNCEIKRLLDAAS